MVRLDVATPTASSRPAGLFTRGPTRRLDPRWEMVQEGVPPSPCHNRGAEREREECLAKAVEPQHREELEQAFDSLRCLECLWLHVLTDADAVWLLEQVDQQKALFSSVLESVSPQVWSEFDEVCRALRESLKSSEGAAQEVMIYLQEVQRVALEVMTQAVDLQRFRFHYKHRDHEGFAVHILALHPQGDTLLGNLLSAKADGAKECWSGSGGRTTYATALHVAAGGGQEQAAALLLEQGVSINQTSQVEEHEGEETRGKGKALMKKMQNAVAKIGPAPRPDSVLSSAVRRVHGHDVRASMQHADRLSPASAPGALEAPDPPHASRLSTPECRRQPHYTALHEATFFQQEEMVRFLLEKRADPNIKNKEEDTALHWAARQGNAGIAQTLVEFRADLKAQGKGNKTALEIAVDCAKFPSHRLCTLMKRNMTEIMSVAERAPNAAKEVLRNLDDEWHKKLNNVKWHQWVELLERAPQVAEDVLDAVTGTPEVVNQDHYGLPRQALFYEREMIRCAYQKDDKWSYNASTQEKPEWHEKFITDPSGDDMHRGSTRKTVQDKSQLQLDGRALRELRRAFGAEQQLVPVRVKLVRIPGLLNEHVLCALKDTDYLDIFRNLAAQAIIECAWHALVKRFYFVHMLHRAIEVGILVAWVFVSHDAETGLFDRASWSWLFACSAKELFYEACEVKGYIRMRQGYFVSDYLMDLKNILDLLSIFMLFMLTIQAWPNQQLTVNLPLLAAVVASRWVQLVYTFRAFPTVGQKVLPIIQSFRPLIGILFITVFIFTGFLHAFIVLNTEYQDEDSLWEVFVSTFRFLFLGDGDAVDVILGLGGRDSTTGDHVTRFFFISAIIGFSIFILNLFIAGADKAYHEAHLNVEARFFQERADICLQCLFRPRITCRSPLLGFCAIVGVMIPAWFLMLVFLPWHPVFASVLLFSTAMLGNAVLLQNDWNPKPRKEAIVPEESVEGKLDSSGAEDTDASPSLVEKVEEAEEIQAEEDDPSPPTSTRERKYLWFCYRIECETPGDGTRGESSGRGSTLVGRKAVEAEEQGRNRHIAEMRWLRRDTQKMQQGVESRLSLIQRQLQHDPLDLAGRLDRLETSVEKLIANMDRLGMGEQPEVQLPEGWESARAPNGRMYYFNRAERKRTWEKPTGPAPAALARGGSLHRLPSTCSIRASSTRNSLVSRSRSDSRQHTSESTSSGRSLAGALDRHDAALEGGRAHAAPVFDSIAEQPGDASSPTCASRGEGAGGATGSSAFPAGAPPATAPHAEGGDGEGSRGRSEARGSSVTDRAPGGASASEAPMTATLSGGSRASRQRRSSPARQRPTALEIS